MLPRDKYTMFDRKEKRYRKGIHSESLFPSPDRRRRHCRPGITRRAVSRAFVLILSFLACFALLSFTCPARLTQNHPPELPKWTRVSQRVNPPGF